MRLRTYLSIAGSCLAHAGLFAALPEARVDVRSAPAPAIVDFDLSTPEPPPVLEEAPEPVDDDAASSPTSAPVAAHTTAPRSQPAPNAPGEPQPAAPLDLTGVTLTNDGDGSWTSAVGNGRPMSAAFGLPRREPVPVATVAAGPVMREAFVAVGDLSKRPVPPNLNDRLERNYPADARRRGLAGRAVVRARIGRSGRVASIAVVSESSPGFAEACRRTLQGSTWSPPRDDEGRAVATEVRYACEFTVED